MKNQLDEGTNNAIKIINLHDYIFEKKLLQKIFYGVKILKNGKDISVPDSA